MSEKISTVLTATLTLLALIIGFSFSMAVSRYDQRKNCEANAIGTEYVRADLLPADDGTKLRELLRKYVNQRILFYHGDEPQISEAASEAQKLQAGAVVARGASSSGSIDPCPGPRRVRHERCTEFARIYTGRVGEPHPGCGMDTDGIDCNCF